MVFWVYSGLALVFSLQALAEGLSLPGQIVIQPGAVKWKEDSSLPAGTKVAILEGDPKKRGAFTVRYRFPPNIKITPHWHNRDERVVVISGSMHIGVGDKIDPKTSTKCGPGCFYMNSARTPHYLWTGAEEAVIQIHGIGPWEINFPTKQVAKP